MLMKLMPITMLNKQMVMLKEIIAPLSSACDLRSYGEIRIFVIPNHKSFVLHHS